MDEAGAYARLNAGDNEENIVITVGAVEKDSSYYCKNSRTKCIQ